MKIVSFAHYWSSSELGICQSFLFISFLLLLVVLLSDRDRESGLSCRNMNMKFKEFWTKKRLVGLLLGQFLSLLITSTGFTSSELAKRGSCFPLESMYVVDSEFGMIISKFWLVDACWLNSCAFEITLDIIFGWLRENLKFVD